MFQQVSHVSSYFFPGISQCGIKNAYPILSPYNFHYHVERGRFIACIDCITKIQESKAMAHFNAANIPLGSLIHDNDYRPCMVVRGPSLHVDSPGMVHYEVRRPRPDAPNSAAVVSFVNTEQIDVATKGEFPEDFDFALAFTGQPSNADRAQQSTLDTDNQQENPMATKAPAKKSPAKKSPAKKAASKPVKAASNGTGTTRRVLGPSGHLQEKILKVTQDYDAGKLTVEKSLTPQVIANVIGEEYGEKPSTGAVAACLARWGEYGFAKITEKPVAYAGLTAAGKKEGLDALKTKHRSRNKKD